MTTSALILFVLLASFLACSSFFLPSNIGSSSHDNTRYSLLMNNNEENLRNLFSNNRYEQSSIYHPRESRNTWFRVSTYQHFKPSAPEETPDGDNLLRWGR